MNGTHLDHPLVLVIFGITGDLAQRKLLPALYNLAQAGELPEAFRIVGVSRRDIAADDIYASLRTTVQDEHYSNDSEVLLRQHTTVFQMDLEKPDGYVRLLDELQHIEHELGSETTRLYYLSIPTEAFSTTVQMLGETGHAQTSDGMTIAPRLLVEKPFGFNTATAQDLIRTLDQFFREDQVYRIDHYVAKETVQNILVFRFQNPLFEGVWNNRHVNHISIVAHEKLDIEGRKVFYEKTGALRDLVQSHLLQLLALTTMDRPQKLDSPHIHAEKLHLLEAITPIDAVSTPHTAVRGQYEGYADEVGNPSTSIETFVRLELQISNERWAGVPIVLETGKALAEKLTEITLSFGSKDEDYDDNQLIFRIQPQEGITFKLLTKEPGIYNTTHPAEMDLDYARSFSKRSADAYERVIVDAIRGDQTLFASSDEVIRSWEIIESLLAEWSNNTEGMITYPKGSSLPLQ